MSFKAFRGLIYDKVLGKTLKCLKFNDWHGLIKTMMLIMRVYQKGTKTVRMFDAYKDSRNDNIKIADVNVNKF